MEVRQAIAWCMDRDQMTQDYCGAFGLRVDGFFGMEQWEYLLVNGGLDYPVDPEGMTDAEYEEAIEKWEELSLDNLVV